MSAFPCIYESTHNLFLFQTTSTWVSRDPKKLPKSTDLKGLFFPAQGHKQILGCRDTNICLGQNDRKKEFPFFGHFGKNK